MLVPQGLRLVACALLLVDCWLLVACAFLLAGCLLLVARTRTHALRLRRVVVANGLVRFIPGDSVKFWMSKNVSH